MNIKYLNVPDNLFIKSQLVRGMKVESEHTDNKKAQKAIAKAHLIETGTKTKTGKYSSKYYDKLSKMEHRLKRRK